jgi:hypothetical protein
VGGGARASQAAAGHAGGVIFGLWRRSPDWCSISFPGVKKDRKIPARFSPY